MSRIGLPAFVLQDYNMIIHKVANRCEFITGSRVVQEFLSIK